MMKYLLTILVFSLSIHLATSQISVELLGGLDRSFRTLNEYDPGNQFVIDSRTENEAPKIQHRFGVNALFKILPSLQFKSGIRYAETGYIENSYDEPPVWPSGPSEEPYLEELFEDYVYIEVPLQLRWSPLADTKVSPYIEGGINPHILLYKEYNLVYSDGNVDKSKSSDLETAQSTYHRVNYVAVASLGAAIKITDQIYCTAQATGRYHLTELAKNDVVINEQHHGIGGEIGVGYQF